MDSNQEERGAHCMSGEITLIALESAQRAGNRVNQILSEWRGGEVRLIQA
jgi:hypothetical protein